MLPRYATFSLWNSQPTANGSSARAGLADRLRDRPQPVAPFTRLPLLRELDFHQGRRLHRAIEQDGPVHPITAGITAPPPGSTPMDGFTLHEPAAPGATHRPAPSFASS